MDIGDIREALAAVVREVVNSGPLPANIEAYPVDSPMLPAILVQPAPFENGQYVNYWGSFGAHLCAIGLRLELRVDGNDIDSAKTLDTYLSVIVPLILAAIEADPTLGGSCATVLGRDSAVPGRFAPAEGDTRTWLSSSVAFEIHARRAAT